MKRIFVVVADGTMKRVVGALFDRLTKPPFNYNFTYDLIVHPENDTGIYRRPEYVLRMDRDGYDAALVILDEAWDGSPGDPEKIRERIREIIVKNSNWKAHEIEVVVISPELEIWAWYDPQRVKDVLGAEDERFWKKYKTIPKREDGKPKDPKQAFESLRSVSRRPIGRIKATILVELVKKAPSRVIKGCRDPEFRRFMRFLTSDPKSTRRW